MGVSQSVPVIQQPEEFKEENKVHFQVKTVTFSDDPEEGFADIVLDKEQHKPHPVPPTRRHRACSVETDGHLIRTAMPVHRPLKDTFLLACKNSYILIDPRNIIVLGQTGAGKSSTICHLLGNNLPRNPSSTDLIKMNPGIYWQSKGTKRLRRVTRSNEVESFKKSILLGTGRTANVAYADLQHHCHSKNRATSVPEPEPDTKGCFGSTFLKDVKMAVTKEVTNADLRGLPLPTSSESSIVLYQFIDCGGMPFFRNLLPQFFPSVASTVFFIVHKLTDRLYENAQVRVLQNGRLVHQVELPGRNIDEIHDWLKIAHSCSAPFAIDGHLGNTFMIGTHFDHLQRRCFNDKSLALEAAFTATEHICEKVISDPSHAVLDPKPIFLKNDLAGTDKCSGIQKLRRKLWNYKPSSKPIELQVMWCALIKHIRELAEELKQPVLALEDFFKIATSFFVSKDEALEILRICEDHCLIFHLSNESYLSKYLFINMQWLFTSLADILHRPDSYCKRGHHYSHWKELTETGFMSVSFHSHLFFHTPQVDCLPSTWASDLLEQLNLMSRINLQGVDGFFCPTLLPLTSDHSTNQRDPFHKDTESDALHIIPQNQSVPPGYLARLFTLLSNIPNKVKLVYCSSQTSATFQLFTNDPNESYFLRVSEDRGGIRLEFCNAFPNQMGALRTCSIANRILVIIIEASDILRKTWKIVPTLDCPVVLEGKIKGFPSLFLRCCNKNCCNSYHLCSVHPQSLNKSKPYVQCCLNQNRMFFSDLPVSQLIWLIKLVEDQVDVYELEQCVSRAGKSSSYFAKTYPMRHYFTAAAPQSGLATLNRSTPAPLPQNPGRERALTSSRALTDEYYPQRTCFQMPKTFEQKSNFILDSYFILLEDHLDLDICNYLFQYGILNNDERTRILVLNANVDAASLQPTSRAQAISTLLDVLKKGNRTDSFMGFITALECTKSTETHCGHGIILDHLQKDNNFMKIKNSWLSSLTVS